MKTRAVRLYGKNNLRLEEFDLPPVEEDEILARVVADSLCMSSYKAAILGTNHKRVPANIGKSPVIIGHEFSGNIIEVGNKWKSKFKPGDKFTVQPALGNNTLEAAGYSFQYFGGDATYVIIPSVYLKNNCILPFKGDGYFMGALAEPYSCVAGTFKSHYHTRYGSYEHFMGIKEGGKMALLGAAGPMGTAAIDYILHNDKKPGLLVVTDLNSERLKRLTSLLTVDEAKKQGVTLIYQNAGIIKDVVSELLSYTNNQGFDDVIVFAPVKSLLETGDKILSTDGCLNFFAGPADPDFSASFNFYNAHYNTTHIVASNGGNINDLKDVMQKIEEGKINPALLVTHIGGLNAAADATLNLPQISGSKKLIYTTIDLPLTAITDFAKKGLTDSLFAELDTICNNYNGLWSVEAENLLLQKGKKVF
ncbi:MAG: zinc-binding dehydrogenase [Bacteroidales bacterium]|nr:zinc-binding dehydrogenase [Bacteroidales bacterium]